MVDRAGSLDQIQGAAGSVQDYSIKLFFSTWMEPVLRQIVKMEHMYETDPVILAVAAKKSQLWIKYGESQVSDDDLQQNLSTVVDVGMGNTDPVKRIQKLEFGIGMINQLPDMPRRIKSQKIADEIMGVLGYKDASRFYMNDQELQQHMKTTPPPPPPPEVQMKQMEIASHEKLEGVRDAREREIANNELAFKKGQAGSQEAQGHLKTMTQEAIANKKDKTMRDIGAAKEANRLAEVNMKRAHEARKPPPKPPQLGKGPPK
jgi:type IV secretory pathway VirB10-like protein